MLRRNHLPNCYLLSLLLVAVCCLVPRIEHNPTMEGTNVLDIVKGWVTGVGKDGSSPFLISDKTTYFTDEPINLAWNYTTSNPQDIVDVLGIFKSTSNMNSDSPLFSIDLIVGGVGNSDMFRCDLKSLGGQWPLPAGAYTAAVYDKLTKSRFLTATFNVIGNFVSSDKASRNVQADIVFADKASYFVHEKISISWGYRSITQDGVDNYDGIAFFKSTSNIYKDVPPVFVYISTFQRDRTNTTKRVGGTLTFDTTFPVPKQLWPLQAGAYVVVLIENISKTVYALTRINVFDPRVISNPMYYLYQSISLSWSYASITPAGTPNYDGLAIFKSTSNISNDDPLVFVYISTYRRDQTNARQQNSGSVLINERFLIEGGDKQGWPLQPDEYKAVLIENTLKLKYAETTFTVKAPSISSDKGSYLENEAIKLSWEYGKDVVDGSINYDVIFVVGIGGRTSIYISTLRQDQPDTTIRNTGTVTFDQNCVFKNDAGILSWPFKTGVYTAAIVDPQLVTFAITSFVVHQQTPAPVPTKTPTKAPTKRPSKAPTKRPSKAPTKIPSKTPTKAPTKAPADTPTKAPTKAPADTPTKVPSKAPTKTPTKAPSKAPTKTPSKAPTKTPTKAPTKVPADTQTKAPSKAPTKTPTKAPTKTPSKAPTKAPSKAPTKAPSKAPTDTKTKAPSKAPSSVFTKAPTHAPMDIPTKAPSPIYAPTESPVQEKCGLFRLGLFCPITFRGFFGRLIRTIFNI